MLWGDQRGYDISKKVKISFIGGGAMASAFVEALFSKSVASEDCVAVSSRSWATLGVVHERHHVHTVLPNREVALLGDVVLLAVKPQNLDRVVRYMPSMPAQIGTGASIWTGSPEVTAEDRTVVRVVRQPRLFMDLRREVSERRSPRRSGQLIGARWR